MVDIVGERRPAALASPLAVAQCAVEAVADCLDAYGALHEVRTGRRPEIVLDAGHVTAAVHSEAWLRDPDGNGVPGFAPLSRLWRTADGWVRTHANYPWHRAALLDALGVDAEDRVAAAIHGYGARELEDLVYARGGLAVACRAPDEWVRLDGPLVTCDPIGQVDAGGRFRVLDLTRVIAGPVATRMLAALGADVLRVDDPRRPELPSQTVDGVVGKASTLLDASTSDGLALLHRLVDEADVVVTGYRPGALRRLGLDADQVADRHPGTIVATLSAWGDTPGWTQRRGFDSLVQVATGIGRLCGTADEPGALPCQLLDHATGYLLAGGVLRALAERASTGVVSQVRVSLARTAAWVLDHGVGPAATPVRPADPAAYRVPFGNGWSGIAPPGTVDGRALAWPHLPAAYGQARAAWSD